MEWVLRVPDGIDLHEDSWAHFQEGVHGHEEAHGQENMDSVHGRGQSDL